MKSKQQALMEWVTDRVAFRTDALGNPYFWDRAGFQEHCEIMRRRFGGKIQRQVYSMLPEVVEDIVVWTDRFFQPANILKLSSEAEVLVILDRKVQLINKALKEGKKATEAVPVGFKNVTFPPKKKRKHVMLLYTG